MLVHSADRQWVQREDPVIREWHGTEGILPGITLVEAGGISRLRRRAHRDGEGRAARRRHHRAGRRARLGDVHAQLPNQIPLSAGLVLTRSTAQRHIDWVDGMNDHLG
ncbi:hypothetical protein [Amycolatopsis rubida]|uniref:hypothetical protein n=1 Tax=Amycolatopsis rubida TaxID=112413 RepID=UPI001FCC6509|nr:hypothetical protein [Amycolatopsis rubida]